MKICREIAGKVLGSGSCLFILKKLNPVFSNLNFRLEGTRSRVTTQNGLADFSQILPEARQIYNQHKLSENSTVHSTRFTV